MQRVQENISEEKLKTTTAKNKSSTIPDLESNITLLEYNQTAWIF